MLAFEPFRVEKRSAVLSPLPKRSGGAQAMSLHPTPNPPDLRMASKPPYARRLGSAPI